MNEFLRKRIERKLASLPEERVYQVLDYVEFLESRYATKPEEEPTPFQKLAETVEDTLRAGKASASVMKGTMDAMGAASRLMGGLVAAGKAVVDEVAGGNAPKPQGPREGAPPDKGDAPPPAEPRTGSA